MSSYGRHKIWCAENKSLLLVEWENLKREAVAMGRQDLIDKYQFPEDWGWRRIDKRVSGMQTELNPPRLTKSEQKIF